MLILLFTSFNFLSGLQSDKAITKKQLHYEGVQSSDKICLRMGNCFVKKLSFCNAFLR